MAVSKIGLPMIAKPDNGVGAAGTYKLETTEDVEQFKQEWDKQTVYFFENSLILDKFVRLTDYWIQKEILCFQQLLIMLIPL